MRRRRERRGEGRNRGDGCGRCARGTHPRTQTHIFTHKHIYVDPAFTRGRKLRMKMCAGCHDFGQRRKHKRHTQMRRRFTRAHTNTHTHRHIRTFTHIHMHKHMHTHTASMMGMAVIRLKRARKRKEKKKHRSNAEGGTGNARGLADTKVPANDMGGNGKHAKQRRAGAK